MVYCKPIDILCANRLPNDSSAPGNIGANIAIAIGEKAAVIIAVSKDDILVGD